MIRLERWKLALAVLLLLVPGSAFALPRYQVLTDLAPTGDIVGVVRLEGAVPPLRRLDVVTGRFKVVAADAPRSHSPKVDAACQHRDIPDESLVVSKSGKAFNAEEPAVLDQRGCRFTPHVLVVGAKQPIKVLNRDGILHNVHVHARRNRGRNIAMGAAMKSMNLTFRRAERVKITCDVHPWMRAWVVTSSHPYCVVTAEDGSFALKNVPPGTYEVEAWHETLGTIVNKVTVAAGKEARTEFVFTRK